MPPTGKDENILFNVIIFEDSTVTAKRAAKEGTESKEACVTRVLWGPKTLGARDMECAIAAAMKWAAEEGVTVTKYTQVKAVRFDPEPEPMPMRMMMPMMTCIQYASTQMLPQFWSNYGSTTVSRRRGR